MYVNLNDRMAGIAANLDDLQSGLEASSRATATLHTDTTKFKPLLAAPLLRSVVRHMKELRECALDQRAALQELRDSVAQLREELWSPQGAVRPPRAIAADARRRR